MGNQYRNIGTNLRNIRRELRISRQTLADRSGISEQTIKQIESGGRDCKVSTIIALSEGLEVSADYLLGLNDAKPTDWELRVKEICREFSAEDMDLLVDIARTIDKHRKQ